MGNTNLQQILVLILLLKLAKSDPEPLQDFCVADQATQQPFYLNGVPCLDPAQATPAHFKTSVLSEPGNTRANLLGFNVTLTNVKNLPGSNTQGLAMARIDLEPSGLVPVHSHPRASEVTLLLEGTTILVGFVDTRNRLFTQNLGPGDSFVFPTGLLHFLYNLDPSTPALAISGLNSQNPGAQIPPSANFMSNPRILDEILERSFQIRGQDVKMIQNNLGG